MTTPLDFEISEAEEMEINRSHLVWTECHTCRARCLCIPEKRRTALCGACRTAEVSALSLDQLEALRGSQAGLQPYTFTRVTLPEAEREPYPTPERYSYQLPDPGWVPPSSVLKLQELAREASWEVELGYSRGHMPHSRTGRPGALKELVGLRFGRHPVIGLQAYAVYSRTASGGMWSWGSVWVSGPSLPPFGGLGIAELTQVLAGTDVGPLIKKAREKIEARDAAKKAAPKTRAKGRENGG